MGHKHQITDATRVKRLVDDGVPVLTLAKEFGVTKESIHNWIRNNSAPYWTRCACEALERRRGGNKKRIVVCEVDQKFVDTLAVIVKAHGGDFHVVGD